MPKPQTLREYTIIVPLHDNTGVPFPTSLIEQLRAELVQAFGGCTRQDGLTGYWTDSEGILYEDVNCSSTVATAARDAQAQIIAITSRWCVALSQLAMYIRLPGGRAIIVEPDG